VRDLKLNAGARWPERRGVWVKYTGSYPPCFLSLCVVCKAVRPREHTVETCVMIKPCGTLYASRKPSCEYLILSYLITCRRGGSFFIVVALFSHWRERAVLLILVAFGKCTQQHHCAARILNARIVDARIIGTHVHR
jgi:hypothetical protein